MAIAYATAAANARLAASLTAAVSGQSVDGGSGVGQIFIGTSAMTSTTTLTIGSTGALAVIALQKPSFTIASKVATMAGSNLTNPAANAGTAALASLCDSAGNVIYSGLTVGTSGANINLNSLAFGVSETITVTSGTISHP